MKRSLRLTATVASLWVPSVFAAGAPHSPIPSDYPGLTIPNAHLVDRAAGTVIRGESPDENLPELKQVGVTEVLIFKNEVKNEVHEEIAALKQLGYTDQQIAHIPFKWKDYSSFREACTQTLSALRLLHASHTTPGRAVYFHCTVGEDRTGYLAGLFHVAEQAWTPRQAFDQEMCPNGYEAGDPRKPAQVVSQIRKEMTPIFLKMAILLATALKNHQNIDPSLCAHEPDAQKFIDANPPLNPTQYECHASPKAPKG